jgi:hypothetical protein
MRTAASPLVVNSSEMTGIQCPRRNSVALAASMDQLHDDA